MEIPIGTSLKFQFYAESRQTTESPEDILMAIEEEEGVSIKDLDSEAYELLVGSHTTRCIAWR